MATESYEVKGEVMTTWRKEFEGARGDDQSPVVAVAPHDGVLDIAFNDGYGSSEGLDVLIWTEQRVYFPVVYDGAEWLGSAPRNPTEADQGHVGGQ